MAFQKCPICDGFGNSGLCKTCAGLGIISESTGLPPNHNNIPQNVAVPVEDAFKNESPFDNLSDDEVLYWATGYYDAIQERKEAVKDSKDEE